MLHAKGELFQSLLQSRRINMIRTKNPNWRELSEAASQEQDSEKLMKLVHELNEVLRRQEEALMELRRRA
jgi:hypothetical protein